MSITSRVLDLFRFSVTELSDTPDDAPAMLPGVTPPPRSNRISHVSTDVALSLDIIYRAIQIHATSVAQLHIDVERRGVAIDGVPSIIEQPDIDYTRRAFVEFTTACLYLKGNAYWRLTRAGATAFTPGKIVNVTPLNPDEVRPARDDKTGLVVFHWRGEQIPAHNMQHLKYLRVDARPESLGLGPLQAAQVQLRGAVESRDYGALWLSEGSTPPGVLTTDQELGSEDARRMKNMWMGLDEDGKRIARNPHDIRVLGKGLSYTPVLLKPADVQFLDTRKFDALGLCRLMAAPASLLLVGVDGKSDTYQNVEQEWISYIRFGLMKPIMEIEDAFSALLPTNDKARMKIESLLRSDTKTRYEAHSVAIDAGLYDEDEARAMEGLPKRTPAQIEAYAERRRTIPAKESPAK